MKFYRIEPKDLGEYVWLKPRKPHLWKVVKKPFKEDKETPRISVAPSLLHCLSALTGNPIYFGSGYLYQLVSDAKIVFPKDKVPDCILTHEHWVLEPALFKRIAPFVIHGSLGLKKARNWKELEQIIEEVLSAKVLFKDGIIHVFDEYTWMFRDLILSLPIGHHTYQGMER